MATLEVPALPDHTSLGEAIGILEQRGLSAVLVLTGGRWVLLDEGALTRAGNTLTAPLSRIAAMNPDVITVPIRPATASAAAMAVQPAARHGIVAERPELRAGTVGMVLITAPRPDQMHRFSLALRYCTCADGHVWAPGDPTTPGKCDYDGFPLTCR